MIEPDPVFFRLFYNWEPREIAVALEAFELAATWDGYSWTSPVARTIVEEMRREAASRGESKLETRVKKFQERVW